MRSPKPMPTALKVVMGDPGKRALKPKPRLAIPSCPAHLQATQKAELKRLAGQLPSPGGANPTYRFMLSRTAPRRNSRGN
jgi:hypothetical protein